MIIRRCGRKIDVSIENDSRPPAIRKNICAFWRLAGVRILDNTRSMLDNISRSPCTGSLVPQSAIFLVLSVLQWSTLRTRKIADVTQCMSGDRAARESPTVLMLRR